MSIKTLWPFTGQALTEAINVMPTQYGYLNALNLFPSETLDSTVAEIGRNNDTLNILTAKARGNKVYQEGKKDEVIYLDVPHLPDDELILAKDIQNMVQRMGNSKGPLTIPERLLRILATKRRNHEITREYMKVGALKGVVVDGSGVTLHNLYDTFGITKQTVDFALGTDGTDIIAKCEEVAAHIRDNIGGDVATGIMFLVSTAFFNKFVQHPKVEKFYTAYQAANTGAQNIANPNTDARAGMLARQFRFQNILLQEYPGSALNASGTSTTFFGGSTGVSFPLGTTNMFSTFDAPPDHIDYVNKPGMEFFISQEVLAHGKGIDLHTESNPLPINKRPQATVELTSSN